MAPSSNRSTAQPSVTPSSGGGFLRRNLGLIAGVALFVSFWMLVYVFMVYRPSFAANAVVIIKDSAITSRYVMPEQYYAMQTTSSSSSNPVLNTMGILKSSAISQAVYEYFKKHRPAHLKRNKIESTADWDKFFKDGTGFIKAKNQPGTDLIAIQFTWSDPVVAKEALDVVVKAFQEASRNLNQEEQISRTKFLAAQVDELEGQLATIRKEKTEYQSRMGTVSVQRESSDLAGSRMELSNRLNQIEAQARGKENLVARYQKMLGMSPEKALKASAMGQNGTITKMQDELYRLQQLYAQLNSQLTETNPKVVEVKAQIEQVQANIAAEKSRTVGKWGEGADVGVVADTTRNTMITSMLTAQAEAQDLRAQAGVIRTRLSQVDAQIAGFPEIAEGLANIEQKEVALSTALANLRQKVLEGRLKEEQTLSNVFIVDAPRVPDRAKFPTQNHLIVLSLGLGLMAGLAVAVGRDQLRHVASAELPVWLEPIEAAPAYSPAAVSTSPGLAPVQIQPFPPPEQDERKVTPPVHGNLFDVMVPLTTSPVRATEAARDPVVSPVAPFQRPVEPEPVSPRERLDQPAVAQSQIQPNPPALPVQPQPDDAPEAPARVSLAARLAQTARTSSLSPVARPLAPQNESSSAGDEQQALRQSFATFDDHPPERLKMSPSRHPKPQTPQSASTHLASNENLSASQAQGMPFQRTEPALPGFLVSNPPVASRLSESGLLAPNDNLLQDVAPIGPPEAISPRKPLGVAPAWFQRKQKSARTERTNITPLPGMTTETASRPRGGDAALPAASRPSLVSQPNR